MHKLGLPDEIRARIAALRGDRRVFAKLEPRSTVLLVIDMQNFFIEAMPAARGIVPNINRIAAALRRAGGRVAWIQATHAEQGRAAWPMFFEHFVDPERGAAIRRQLMPGSPGHSLYAGLDVQPGDLRFDKDRFSAFVKGPCDLEAELRTRSVDTVIIVGTNTNVCCESTARDAMMRDFRTYVVEDANAAYGDDEHVAGLVTVAQVFAEVLTTDELLSLIVGSAG